jgi:hypothetical protein
MPVWSAPPVLSGQIRRPWAEAFFLVVLLWLETEAGKGCTAGISVNNKALVRGGFGGPGPGSGSPLFPPHGDEKDWDSMDSGFWWPDLQQGSKGASLGSFLTAAQFSSAYLKAKGGHSHLWRWLQLLLPASA